MNETLDKIYHLIDLFHFQENSYSNHFGFSPENTKQRVENIHANAQIS